MADMRESSHKKSRKTPQKVRVRLPGIESYEKTLEFAAEGPGRVVVRLERLMGSDRIRITDPKYLATLVERLEAEETQSWGSRSRLRKKAEKNRSRQLAIEGLMEPTEDMQDLYEHPVFRVNRVLNRLATFDTNFTGADTNVNKIPPIIPVEPFTDDQSGRVFKSYPQHQVFHKEVLPYANVEYYSRASTHHPSRADLTRGSHAPTTTSPQHHSAESSAHSKMPMKKGSEESVKSKNADATGVKSTKSLFRAGPSASSGTSKKPSDINLPTKSSTKISKMNEGEWEDEEDEMQQTKYSGKADSLKDFRLRYGVPSDADLVKDWQAFRSHLVERVYEESGGSAEELYTLANHVIGTYDRQLEVVDDFVEVHADKVKEQRRAMGLPSDPSMAKQSEPEEGGDNEEENDEDEEEKEDEEEAEDIEGDEEKLEKEEENDEDEDEKAEEAEE